VIEAVKDVTVHINQGDIYGIVGYSGAGKSTLVRVINLLQVPTAGKITIDGDVTYADGKVQLSSSDLRQKRRDIGMIFQHFNLMAQKTARENVAFALKHSGLSKEDKAKKVLARCEKDLPAYNVPHDYQSGSVDLARCYALTGQDKKAQMLIDELWIKSCQYLVWYLSFDGTRFSSSQHDCLIHFYILEQLLNLQDTVSQEEADKKEQQLQSLMGIYQSKGGDIEG
jgi:ABC-type sugar transport system ATPase subunit